MPTVCCLAAVRACFRLPRARQPHTIRRQDTRRGDSETAGQTGFCNGGWDYDRYENLKPLNVNSTIGVADIKGPGIIRHIHTTRYKPEELMSRGIVLEIWFEDANEPAVRRPVRLLVGVVAER